MSKNNNYILAIRQTFGNVLQGEVSKVKDFLQLHFNDNKKEELDPNIVKHFWDVAQIIVKKCVTNNKNLKAIELVESFQPYKNMVPNEISTYFNTISEPTREDTPDSTREDEAPAPSGAMPESEWDYYV